MPRLRMLKHEMFAQYLADGTHYLKAYELCGNKPVQQHASRLANKPDIRARVAELVSRRAYKGGEVSQTRVMTELSRLAFSDIRRVAQWVSREELVPVQAPQGKNAPTSAPPMATRRVTDLMIFDSDKIDDDTAAAIQSITRGKDGSLQVKFYDKRAALIDIGKQLGMFTDKVEIGRAGDFAKLNDEELERFIRAKVVSLGPMLDGEEAQEESADEALSGLGAAVAGD